MSAEPLWLAVGHGDRGTATVTECTDSGAGPRCIGAFTATDDRFTVDEVTVLDVEQTDRHAGATVPARMVSPEGRGAFAGDRSALHLRWAIGLLLALACGPAIAVATGATRLDGRRARLVAFGMSLTAPLLVVAGFLAASF